jgi:hypothetical protein
MRFSGVAIPLLAADGSAYTPHAFALDLAADLHDRTGLGVRATVTVVVRRHPIAPLRSSIELLLKIVRHRSSITDAASHTFAVNAGRGYFRR